MSTASYRSRPGLRRTSPRVLAALLALLLATGVADTVTARPGQPRKPVTAAVQRGRVAPSFDWLAGRERAVLGVLAARAAAIRDHDRQAWLATVDPAAGQFRERQAALFDALAAVPLRDWSYRLDPAAAPAPQRDVTDLHGAGWWAPGVVLSYRIAGFDASPTVEAQRLTFVPRGQRWYVAADDDFAGQGSDTTRGVWDFGPVTSVRGQSCLVLGHTGSGGLLRQVADLVDAAVPRVSAVWGTGWSRRVVVLVPSSQSEFNRVVGGRGDYSQIAAVATAELADASSGYHPVGDRVMINPANFAKLSALGRRVVLTHEVTHVATRTASGPAAPAWLVEGFADYVGYLDVHVPYALSAAELRDAVQAGHVPSRLPSDQDFDGRNPQLGEVYEEAWLAVSLLAEQHGQDGLLRFYRTVGRVGAPVSAVEDALHSLWASSVSAFTAQWRRDLVARLR